ncbi:thioesterase family protein [Rhodococcus triatomae]|uniref:Thioesterase-like superfamily protein n=1 Tax=Rhodococcus triatomae TaxID=300028 RepID=A0A1G8J5B9_9NOCA|nr:thioesterase family protein [Rhodococcus triatomae]QNG19815.1 thioesterase family protein [Rhodococcus triatomae]QNG24269.1 thioesterase family protein [Rhodococcus triatomae]SDI26223.1 Thioesterase-like superfamily protein [Rhodococcus triatomae]
MTGTPFRDLTTLVDLGDGRFTATIDPMWTIGPKVHGGSMMSLAAVAARNALLGTDRPESSAPPAGGAVQPLAVSANYLAAPDPGEVSLTATIRKRGKQVSFVDVELAQGDRVAVRGSVTLGVPDSEVPTYATDTALAALPAEPPSDAVVLTDDHPMGRIVHVSRGCDMRIDGSSAHFLTGSQGEPEVRMWVRPRPDDENDADTAALFAIMAGDISAPVTMNRGLFGWAPTVQLTTYLRRRPTPGWLRVMASSAVLGGTWFEEDHTVLDSTGAVVVQSRQLAMIPR